MLSLEASLDDVVRELNSPDFDALKLVDTAVDSKKTLKEQYSMSLSLAATLNAHSEELASALESALTTLQTSEKRVPHEVNLLKNDVEAVNSNLQDALPEIAEAIQLSRRSEVLADLDALQQVKNRLMEVEELLKLAANTQPGASNLSAEQAQQLARVIEGTPDEARWAAAQNKPGYYGLINKIIN